MRFDAPRPTFAKRPTDDPPAPHTDRATARRTAQLAEAADALTVLPGPGEAVHCIWTARADLMHGLVAIVGQLGTVEAMRIATLAYSNKNLAEMVRLLDSGAVRRLTLLCSSFFRDHNTDVWEETISEFRARGQRAAAARSHCKVVTFAFASGRRLTLEGSANLRSNGNRENLTLIDGASLHDWHAAWIDELVTAHEGEQSDDPGAG
jgi:hypothetical protein